MILITCVQCGDHRDLHLWQHGSVARVQSVGVPQPLLARCAYGRHGQVMSPMALPRSVTPPLSKKVSLVPRTDLRIALQTLQAIYDVEIVPQVRSARLDAAGPNHQGQAQNHKDALQRRERAPPPFRIRRLLKHIMCYHGY